MAYDNSLAAPTTGTPISKTGFGDKVVGNIQAVSKRALEIRVIAKTTQLTTGDNKEHIHIPSTLNGMILSAVHALVDTAGTTGTTDIQIHNVTDAVDILSTKLTIDSGETGSDTAASAAVINTSNDDMATNDEIRFDIDAVSTTAPYGLIITLEFTYP